MKNLIFSLVFVVCSLSSFSAEKDSTATKKSRHELMFGVNNPLYKSSFGSINDMYSYFILTEIYDDYYYPYYYPSYYTSVLTESMIFNSAQDGRKLGLGYRFHLKNSSVRLLINGDSKSESGNENHKNTQDSPYSDYLSESIFTYKMGSVQARLGYQLHKTKGRAQLFYGIDFFYKAFQYKADQDYVYSDWDYVYDGFEYDYVLFENKYTNEYKYTQSSMGFSTTLGLRYFLTDNLSLSTESYIDFGMNTTKSNAAYSVNYGNFDNEDYSSESSEENTSREMKAVPVSLISLNFHF